MTTENETNGWVKLYHPTGAQVTFPVSLVAEMTLQAALNAFNSINTLIGAGFSVNVPGLEAGENVDEVGFVLRKKQKNDRGESIRIEFYPAAQQLTRKLMHTYLDSAEQITDFEQATGLSLRTIPIYVGKDSPERGQDDTTDAFIVKLPHPVKVVWKDNPAYDPAETDTTKKKPKRLFVRFDGVSASSKPAMTLEQEAAYRDAGEVLAPGGVKISTLSDDLLERLAKSTKDGVTAEMKAAAKIRLSK